MQVHDVSGVSMHFLHMPYRTDHSHESHILFTSEHIKTHHSIFNLMATAEQIVIT